MEFINNDGIYIALIHRCSKRLKKWSKKFRYRITLFGVTLTPNLTPSFLLLKKGSFYSQSGVKITPKWGYFYSLHGLFLLFLELI